MRRAGDVNSGAAPSRRGCCAVPPSRIHSAAIEPSAGDDCRPDPPAPATATTHGTSGCGPDDRFAVRAHGVDAGPHVTEPDVVEPGQAADEPLGDEVHVLGSGVARDVVRVDDVVEDLFVWSPATIRPGPSSRK
jgi:hypothetical protein